MLTKEKFRNQTGYTIIELVTALTIVGMILSYAIPSFQDVFETTDQNIKKNEVLQILAHARSVAVADGSTYMLCGLDNKNADLPVFKDKDCHTNFSKGFVIQSIGGNIVEKSYTKDVQNLHFKGFNNNIRFYSDGSTNANGRFFICSDKEEVVWQVVINRQGRARVASQEENSKYDGCRQKV